MVGPCASGKSSLVTALREAGYQAHHVVQEHSYVPYMWQRITQPDVLIYLDVSYEQARQRRRITWGPERLAEQAQRLAHARAHADLYLNTDSMEKHEVVQRVLVFLASRAGEGTP